MTTIATDGRTIAADSRAMRFNNIDALPVQKIRVVGRRIYALSGAGCVFDAAIAWFAAGADAASIPKVDDVSWSLLVIDAKGARLCGSSCPYPERVPQMFAFGAGMDFAIGAMEMKATPEQAVAIAAKHNNCTGGTIQVVDIAAVLKGRRGKQSKGKASRSRAGRPAPSRRARDPRLALRMGVVVSKQ